MNAARAALEAVAPLIRAAALEEAAKIVADYDPAFSATNSMLDDIAAAIRALRGSQARKDDTATCPLPLSS